MARILSLVMAGLLVCSVGCMGGRWVGEHKPPWPQPLEPDAYAQVQPTVQTPGLDSGHVAIAGGRIDDHGVYIDILIETREDPEIERYMYSLINASYFGHEPGRYWFMLSHTTGEVVRVVPVERPQFKGRYIPAIQFKSGYFDRLNGAPGRSRYNMVVWYRTEAQLEPGTYTLFVPDIEDVNSNWAR
ncbi:MAG: hypothetical protein IIC93_10615, partial [Chloroflexi bacterium]|nr:hypothetical protein [Chloroflexota bacterium]